MTRSWAAAPAAGAREAPIRGSISVRLAFVGMARDSPAPASETAIRGAPPPLKWPLRGWLATPPPAPRDGPSCACNRDDRGYYPRPRRLRARPGPDEAPRE